MAKPEIIPDKVEKAIPPDPVLAKAEYPIPEKGDRNGFFGPLPPSPRGTVTWFNTNASRGSGEVSGGLANSTTSTRQ